jgi:hypothetical protein
MTGTRLLLAATLLVATGLTGFAGAAPAEVGDPTDSAVTVPGKGEFADLRVTVNQTRNLINQFIRVSWTGGKPTVGATTNNFLQVMQCWGGDPGPDRTQCQFGAVPSNWLDLGTRHLLPPHVTDPRDPLDPEEPNSTFVPYWVPGEPKPTKLVADPSSPYLDAQLSNEAPQLPTRQNGTGEEFFEVQTFRENAGLDCGKAVGTAPAVTGRSCWLVVVPRGTTEVDGSTQAQLESSPLSKTNWDKRIQIKLEFLPVEQSCRLGAAERAVRGNEMAVEAVSRWQPALCGNGGTVFSYTQYSDELARSALSGSDPALQIVTNPVPADGAPPDRPLIYAPVALSGLAIAFNLEHQPFGGAPTELEGTRFTELKLTPRLVAKLLTQSYTGAVAGEPEQKKRLLGDNPLALTRDPEFLRYNPDYRNQDLTNRSPEAIVQFGNADVTALLWAWILGDADARAFLTGTPAPHPDPMVVNPSNKGITEPLPVFPRNDASCEPWNFLGTIVQSCTGDQHPVAGDMHEAGRSAGRGDIYSRTPAEVLPGVGDEPPLVRYSRPGRAGVGKRSVLAVVDTATAARYGLRLATLQNAAGQFVAPTRESLLAGLAAMKPSGIPGVLQPDPRTTNAAAYPLTALSYAATAPSVLDKPAGKAYADFLNYAAGPGQEPGVEVGRLPFGYEPLPWSLRVQTILTAASVSTLAGVPVANPPAAPENPGGTGGSAAPADGGSVPAGASTPAPAPAPAPSTSAAPGTGTAVVTKAEPTPAVKAPAVWTLIVGLLICGAVAGALAPLAHYLGGRRRPGPDGGNS